MDKYKAQLVVKGFAQRSGIDFPKTHILVAKFAFMKTLLVLGVICNREIHQMDVKGVFLSGELTKDMHKKQLDGYKNFNKRNLVYKSKEVYMAKNKHNVFGIQKLTFSFEKMIFKNANLTRLYMYLKLKEVCKYFLNLYIDDLLT